MLRAAALPRVRRPRLPRPSRALLAAPALLLLLGGGWLWLRDSALVRVDRVEVTGLTGPEASRVRALLTDAARDMTTLNVDAGRLRAIVEPYPVVDQLEVHSTIPHGLRIVVHERVPVAALVGGGSRIAVAGDGTLLRRSGAGDDLPVVAMKTAPGGARIGDGRTGDAIRALAAAPAALRKRIVRVGFTPKTGLVMDVRDGPDLRFGSIDRLDAKWASVVAVLADESSAGAVYLDVRYPERPAAGGLEDPAEQLDPEAANTATTPAPAAGTASPTPTTTQP